MDVTDGCMAVWVSGPVTESKTDTYKDTQTSESYTFSVKFSIKKS